MGKKTSAIVLSAGSGKRMNSEIPKQYLPLDGRPVIYYSLKAFEESTVSEIVLVCSKDDIEYCRKEIVEKYHLTKVHRIVEGGAERYDSVFCGLKALEDTDYVLIHDGARPMLTVDMIERSLESVEKDPAVVLAVPAKDTIKVSDENGYAIQTPDRNTLWNVQTPQTFTYRLIYDAYQKLISDIAAHSDVPAITDDAMVAEYATDKKVRLIQGDYMNIKITTPEDLAVAEVFLEKIKKTVDNVD